MCTPWSACKDPEVSTLKKQAAPFRRQQSQFADVTAPSVVKSSLMLVGASRGWTECE